MSPSQTALFDIVTVDGTSDVIIASIASLILFFSSAILRV